MNRRHMMQRGRAQAAAIVLLILCTTPAIASGSTEAPGSGAPQSPPTEFGIIEYLEGEVTVEGEVATIGDRVRAGQLVETGPGGLAEIVFDDRNVFQLRENTVIRLGLRNGEVRTAELEEGSFAAVFDRLRKVTGDRSFEIRTPTTVAGVRGTTFFVRVESVSSTYVCTCNGETELEGADNNAPVNVDATYHTAYRFVRDADGVRTESAPLLYHTDSEMNALASTIGATIPWYQ